VHCGLGREGKQQRGERKTRVRGEEVQWRCWAAGEQERE